MSPPRGDGPAGRGAGRGAGQGEGRGARKSPGPGARRATAVAKGKRAGPAPTGLTARRAAVGLVAGVLDRGAMLDEASLGDLEPAERAEARGLADMVLRRLGQIDAELGRLIERAPPSPTSHILRLMAGEILFAGTPPHAAVDSAVHLARGARNTARFGGLVNAVGRKLAGLSAPDAPEPAANTPRWLARRLVADWGREAAEAIMAAHLVPAPHDISVANPADAAGLAEELGATILPSGTLRLAGRPQLSALPGFSAGAWWVQDAAAALPARLLAPRPGTRVLDLCAAPGGKTLQLAAMGADVTAVDANPRRMERLRANLERTGLSAKLVVADMLDWAPDSPFDAILIDAPCSATGTLRRHPDLPHRFGSTADGADAEEAAAAELSSLTDLQASLLRRAWPWLAPGGTLVFATCSLLAAEGEDQIAAFLAHRADARRMALASDDPALPPGAVTADGDLRCLPSMLPSLGGIDGFYAACLHRRP